MPVQLQNQRIRQLIIDQLGYVQGQTPDEIRAAIDDAGGDLELDSKLGQTVAIRVAVLLDMEDLIRPQDQKRRNLTSTGSLQDLICRRVAEYEAEVS